MTRSLTPVQKYLLTDDIMKMQKNKNKASL